MHFTTLLPDKQGTIIEFNRDWFTGSLSIKANGKDMFIQSAMNPSTHFGLSLKRHYDFSLPGPEPRNVRITKVRPLFFAGFRSCRYQVLFNDVEIKSYVGM